MSFCWSDRQSGRYLLHFGDLGKQKSCVFAGPTFNPVPIGRVFVGLAVNPDAIRYTLVN